jgi:hypothetical protein
MPASRDRFGRIPSAQQHETARCRSEEKPDVVRETITPVGDDVGLANNASGCPLDGPVTWSSLITAGSA